MNNRRENNFGCCALGIAAIMGAGFFFYAMIRNLSYDPHMGNNYQDSEIVQKLEEDTSTAGSESRKDSKIVKLE